MSAYVPARCATPDEVRCACPRCSSLTAAYTMSGELTHWFRCTDCGHNFAVWHRPDMLVYGQITRGSR